MKLIASIQTILLYPVVNGNLGCEGEPRYYPADLKFIIVKRKKNAVLIRAKHAGFAWVHPEQLAKSQ